MSTNEYLDKYAYFGRLIEPSISSETRLIIVIPVYNEESILQSLKSLDRCDPPRNMVEVIIVFNSSERDEYQVRATNERARLQTLDWVNTRHNAHIKYHVITAYDLPSKFAGVGFARKIGMDEAVLRFTDIQRKDGIIVGFDADSICDENYLIEIERFFDTEIRAPGCSIYFEHPISGTDFPGKVYDGIQQYELHLRYYIQSCRYTGHPHAFHTVGSSFAVRNESYQKQGGMNRKKAGEDFYFLQKIISLGHFNDLKTTRVIPSPRPSDRVPFGTGRAINKWISDENDFLLTYHPNTFVDLRKFFQLLPEFYLNKENPVTLFNAIPNSVISFLENYYFKERLEEINRNTKYINSYYKRFYNWFDAFMLLKFSHYYRDHIKPMIQVEEAAKNLLEIKGISTSSHSAKDLLNIYRKIERQ